MADTLKFNTPVVDANGNVVTLADMAGGGTPPTGTIEISENGRYNVARYASANVNVPGIVPTGTKTITENGTYDVTEYAGANVNVPGIVPTGTKTITENGTYDVTEYAGANVNVPGIVPTGTKTITENGTYDVTEFASALVNVSGGGLPTGWVKGEASYDTDTNVLTITHNLNASSYLFFIFKNIIDHTANRVFEITILKDGNRTLTTGYGGNGTNFTGLSVTNAYDLSVTENAITLDGTDKSQFRPFNGTYTWLAIPYT